VTLIAETTLLAEANRFAETTQGAPLSALVWWIIPLLALAGGLIYALWVSRLRRRYENQTERSVGRFKKFQDSFNEGESNRNDSQGTDR
jgi:hypothetical protein